MRILKAPIRSVAVQQMDKLQVYKKVAQVYLLLSLQFILGHFWKQIKLFFEHCFECLQKVELCPNILTEYLIAMGKHARRLVAPILVIPTRPPERAPNAAPNLLFGSLYGDTYFPSGVTSAVLFSKFSRGMRTLLKNTKLKKR